MSEELYELPKGWVWTSVGEIYGIVGGGTPSTSVDEYWEGDIAWITSADIHGLKDIRPRKGITRAAIENSTTNLVPEGSLIVATRVGLGKVALTKMPLCFSQDSQALVNHGSSIYPDYSLYYLAQTVQIFKYRNRGTTIGGITKKQLSKLPFALPPTAEQQRIVGAIEQQISCINAGVMQLRQTQKKLKQYRASILKAAVEGELTSKWRRVHSEVEPASELLKRILVERRAKWEEEQRAKGKDPSKLKYVEPADPDANGLPQLPQGWCWVTLGQIATFQNGRGFPSSEYTSQGFKLLRPGNLFADGTIRWTETNTRYLPEAWAEGNPDLIIRGSELVMNLTAQSLKDEFLGRVCITSRDESCLLNQRLARITPLREIDPFYVLHMLKSTIFRQFVDKLNKGSLIQHMFTSQLTNFCCPLPPLLEQKQIADLVEERLSLINELEAAVERALKRAEKQRQSILQRAFTGKLVPQDPNDEPASVLLEHIRKEHEQLNQRDKQKVTPARKTPKTARTIKVSGQASKPIEGEEVTQSDLWQSVEAY